MTLISPELRQTLKSGLQSKTVRWALYMFVSGVLRVVNFTLEDANSTATLLENGLEVLWGLFDIYATTRVAANRLTTSRVLVDGQWHCLKEITGSENGSDSRFEDVPDVAPIPRQPRVGFAPCAPANPVLVAIERRMKATVESPFAVVESPFTVASVPDPEPLVVSSETGLPPRIIKDPQEADAAWAAFKASAAAGRSLTKNESAEIIDNTPNSHD